MCLKTVSLLEQLKLIHISNEPRLESLPSATQTLVKIFVLQGSRHESRPSASFASEQG